MLCLICNENSLFCSSFAAIDALFRRIEQFLKTQRSGDQVPQYLSFSIQCQPFCYYMLLFACSPLGENEILILELKLFNTFYIRLTFQQYNYMHTIEWPTNQIQRQRHQCQTNTTILSYFKLFFHFYYFYIYLFFISFLLLFMKLIFDKNFCFYFSFKFWVNYQ